MNAATDNRIAFVVTEPDRRGLHVGVMVEVWDVRATHLNGVVMQEVEKNKKK